MGTCSPRLSQQKRWYVIWNLSFYSPFVHAYLVTSDPLQPHGLQPTRFLCPWDFLGQEYWSGLPFPSPGDDPDPGIKPAFPVFADRFFTTGATGDLLKSFWGQFQSNRLTNTYKCAWHCVKHCLGSGVVSVGKPVHFFWVTLRRDNDVNFSML